jgi:asparagine synthase (glutamine-hydrolysing)
MCGIAGVLGPPILTEPLIAPMLDSLIHRGPDDSDVWVGENCALGNCRLSIIDLDGGHQPMWTSDGRYGIVYNGELYNYLELRSQLAAKGYAFTTQSDTEVLLALFAVSGFAAVVSTLRKLQGMFSFAVIDRETNQALLARDQFGMKPLYFRIQEDFDPRRLHSFASEIKSLVIDPSFTREIHLPAVLNYLSFQFNPLHETFFCDIHELPAGNFLQVQLESGHFIQEEYWRYEFTKENIETETEALTVGLVEAMENSVARHLVGDVPIGAFLSGGVDSAIAVTLAQEQRLAAGQSPLKTFTLGFSELSEFPEAKQLAERIGTDHHEIVVSADEYLAALPEIARIFDEPVADPSAVALYFLAKEAHKEVGIVLSGEGADELFGGYLIYREPIDLDWVRQIPAGIGKFISRAALRIPLNFLGRNYLRRTITPLRERYIGNAYTFTPTQARSLMKAPLVGAQVNPYDVLLAKRPGFESLSEQRQMQLMDLDYWLPGNILAKSDRMSMAHSLELRAPFLDMEVASISSQVSDTLKFRGGTTKWLLRHAFRDRLPATTASRKKIGFHIPWRIWLSADPETVIAPIRKSAFLTEIIDMDYFEALVTEHVSGAADHSRRIFILLMLALWHEAYFNGNGRLNSPERTSLSS